MESLVDQILRYSELSAEERLVLEARAAAYPELQPLLDEARAWTDLFTRARSLQEVPPDDEMLAFFVVTRALRQQHDPPAPLRTLSDRLAAHLQADPARRARYDALARSLQALEAGRDRAAHFERLTGHRLDPIPAPEAAPATPRRRPALLGLLALPLLYGLLFVASEVTRSPTHALARLDTADRALFDDLARHAGPPPAHPSDTHLLLALGHLQQAPTTFLGLFPRFDRARLRAAVRHLEAVRTREAAGSPRWHTASLLLGKSYLALEDPARARAVLQPVAESTAPQAARAASLLRALAP